jgi:hypothetical protein
VIPKGKIHRVENILKCNKVNRIDEINIVVFNFVILKSLLNTNPLNANSSKIAGKIDTKIIDIKRGETLSLKIIVELSKFDFNRYRFKKVEK